MSVSWLHISDFHIRGGDSYDRDVVLGALVRSARELRERHGREPDLIFATGDIAHSGKATEYALATSLFDALLEATRLARRHLFLVPGNHDVDRDQGVGLARTLTSGEEADKYFNPAIPKPHLSQKLGAFRDWYNDYFKGIRELPATSTCGPVEGIDIRGLRIAVLPLNSALFCLDRDDHNKLLLGRRCLEGAIDALKEQDAQLRVALVHHPLDWLSDIERSNIKASLQNAVDVILRGHLHENDVASVVSLSGSALHLAAGASYQTRKWPNRALFSTVEDGRLRVFPLRYEDSPTEIWTVDPSLFPYDSGYERCFPLHGHSQHCASQPTDKSLDNRGRPESAPRFRSNIPSRGELPFLGREPLLKTIETALGEPSRERVLVLHGPPGVGKSELAREFARRQRDRYPGGTFFVRTGAGAGLMDLARIGANVLDLRFPADLSLQDQCERTILALGIAPVLLIYDNVVDAEQVRAWLPPSGMPCHVLVTSVNERLSVEWTDLSVPPLPPEVSLQLVEAIAGPDVATRLGGALVVQSGGLPIEIVPVSRALAYEARRGRLNPALPDLSTETHASFRLVYDTLNSAAHLLLHAAAFLNTQHILREELFHHLSAGTEGDSADLERCLDTCLDLHLLEGNDDLRMHQLFATFVLGIPLEGVFEASLQSVRERQRQRFAILGRDLAAKPADGDLAYRLLAYPLKPAAWERAKVAFAINDGDIIGRALYEIGKFDEARVWFERAVAEAEQGDVHGRVDHERLGTSLHQIGVCLTGFGKYDEAKPWFERARNVSMILRHQGVLI